MVAFRAPFSTAPLPLAASPARRRASFRMKRERRSGARGDGTMPRHGREQRLADGNECAAEAGGERGARPTHHRRHDLLRRARSVGRVSGTGPPPRRACSSAAVRRRRRRRRPDAREVPRGLVGRHPAEAARRPAPVRAHAVAAGAAARRRRTARRSRRARRRRRGGARRAQDAADPRHGGVDGDVGRRGPRSGRRGLCPTRGRRETRRARRRAREARAPTRPRRRRRRGIDVRGEGTSTRARRAGTTAALIRARRYWFARTRAALRVAPDGSALLQRARQPPRGRPSTAPSPREPRGAAQRAAATATRRGAAVVLAQARGRRRSAADAVADAGATSAKPLRRRSTRSEMSRTFWRRRAPSEQPLDAPGPPAVARAPLAASARRRCAAERALALDELREALGRHRRATARSASSTRSERRQPHRRRRRASLAAVPDRRRTGRRRAPRASASRASCAAPAAPSTREARGGGPARSRSGRAGGACRAAVLGRAPVAALDECSDARSRSASRRRRWRRRANPLRDAPLRAP